MSLWFIAWRGIQHRGLASALTVLSMTLGVASVAATLTIYAFLTDRFTDSPGLGFHLVVGKKGGDYQLVLNTIYHLSRPIENVPYSYYRRFTNEPLSHDELAAVLAAGFSPDDPKYSDSQMSEASPAQRNAALLRDFTRFTPGQLMLCDRDGLLAAFEAWKPKSTLTFDAWKAAQPAPVGQASEADDASDDETQLTRFEQEQARALRMTAAAKQLRGMAAGVKKAIPYCLGDNYQGFRVVGTVPELFDPEFQYGPNRRYTFADGRNFKREHFYEAVLGSAAAAQTKLKVGDGFSPTHSFSEGGDVHDDHFTIVGVLAPTGTPNDRAVFINMEGFYLMDKHSKPLAEVPPDDFLLPPQADFTPPVGLEINHGRTPLPEIQREVTAVLLEVRNDLVSMNLARRINEGKEAQAASPVAVSTRLYNTFVGPMARLILVLTWLIVVVACIGVLVSIYNSMNERQREIAVMRALGARRVTVMSIVLLESILLSMIAGGLGLLVGHVLAWLGGLSMAQEYGVTIGLFDLAFFKIGPFHNPLGRWGPFHVPAELAIIGGLMLLSTLVGWLPAATVYRTNVAAKLNDSP